MVALRGDESKCVVRVMKNVVVVSKENKLIWTGLDCPTSSSVRLHVSAKYSDSTFS
jgi:hypothetical protein